MKFLIVGGTSQIARDFISSRHTTEKNDEFILYSRDPLEASVFFASNGIHDRVNSFPFDDLSSAKSFDVLLNFVGTGDPKKTQALGWALVRDAMSIDSLCMALLETNPGAKYIYTSSGAVYGSVFLDAPNAQSKSEFALTNPLAEEIYGLSKMVVETSHRAHSSLAIVDLRIFNYFSDTSDLSLPYFLNSAISCLLNGEIFATSAESITRDYLGKTDFALLVDAVIRANGFNGAVDCFSKSPVEKFELLTHLGEQYGLKSTISAADVNSFTGSKKNYYSLNHSARSIGYEPQADSIAGIDSALETILASRHSKNQPQPDYNLENE